MSFATTTKRVSDVLTDIKRTFGDESAVQVTDTDILRWTNSAQREILITNRILKSTATQLSVGNQSEYTLTTLNIVAIQSIHYNGQKVEYRSFNEAEEYILSGDPKRTATGIPAIWYEWGGTLNFYPMPQSSGDTITIYYISEPPELTTTNDKLSVPDAYYENILQFVMSKAYELDEDNENSQYKLSQFANRLGALSERESTPEQDYYPMITVRVEDGGDWY